MDSDLLTDREKAAVLWADHVTKNTARSRDDVYELVASRFTPAEMVELTMMTSFFNMFNRITDSLRIDIELPNEVDKIKRSVDLDPANLKRYLETLLENWPDDFPAPGGG